MVNALWLCYRCAGRVGVGRVPDLEDDGLRGRAELHVEQSYLCDD